MQDKGKRRGLAEQRHALFRTPFSWDTLCKINVRRVVQVASLAGLIGLLLLYPIIEAFDRWDAPEPSLDTELQIIILLTFVSFVFLLGKLLSALLVAVLTDTLPFRDSRPHARLGLPAFIFDPDVTASPPIPLRI